MQEFFAGGDSWGSESHTTFLRYAVVAAVVAVVALAALLVPDASAQTTRTEEIEQARRDKQANLWPERESPFVARPTSSRSAASARASPTAAAPAASSSCSRDAIGPGHLVGIGWRQTDLWQERLGLRTTARARCTAPTCSTRGSTSTPDDGTIVLQPVREVRGFAADGFLRARRGLQEANRSSFLLRDFAVDFQAGVALSRRVRVGATGGGSTSRLALDGDQGCLRPAPSSRRPRRRHRRGLGPV